MLDNSLINAPINGLKKTQVLVIDDQKGIRYSLKQAIDSSHFQCFLAENAEEALNILEENNDIEIAICDIMMPGTDGIELCKRIKEKDKVDVVLMTAAVENISFSDAIEIGATDFIEKPVSVKELHMRLNRIIDHRSLIGEYNAVIEKQKDTLNTLENALSNLRQFTRGIIKVLSAMIEVRDPYTAGHQRRVADLARAIADDMGLDKHRVQGIRMAGTIHDIGKISIPAELLSKPSKLTDSEFELIKSHSQVGHDIVESINFPWPIADIILQHHCRFNGSGYPDQLKNSSILLEARIIGVADVVEAISSHRPYRPALGIETALDEIEKNKGVLYDPDVVNSCLSLFKSGKFDFK